MSQESMAGAELPPDLGCLQAVCGVSAFWYQHLMAVPKGAPPGRTSKTSICIQWFLWHVCGKLCQMNGLQHTRLELLTPFP